MHRIAALLVAGVCLGSAFAQIPRDEYRARREAVRKELGANVLVLFGRSSQEMEGHDGPYGQQPDFYYLTGWTEPGAILLLTAENETLFLPKHNERRELYTGQRTAANDRDAHSVTGFEDLATVEQFESRFAKALESHSGILALKDPSGGDRLQKLAPLREFSYAAPLLGRQRLKKSEREIQLVQHSIDVTADAHRAAWKRAAAGLFEYRVAATSTFTMLDAGCEGDAYPPIVGSGPNATVLHYSKNSRRMEAGELLLMDMAAQCSGYASDVTRTIPVSGMFSARQRELYDVVLGAQLAAIAAVKPGVTIAEVNRIAREYINTHGSDKAGKPLGKYLTHGISHGVGLEVHDFPQATWTEPLQAGMIITIEPGLYIPDEKIGIRIEDTLVVTDKGARVMSAAIPKDPAEIEKVLAK